VTRKDVEEAAVEPQEVTPEEEGIPDLQPRSVEERFRRRVTMHVPDRNNPRLHSLMEWVNQNDELYAYWVAANVTAIERLGMTDHGPVHVKIVTNIALRLLRLLMDGGIQPSVVTHYGMSRDDAEIVVALAALLHDIGMSIHRTDHEEYSLFLAHDVMKGLPEDLFSPHVCAIVRSEVLHAIIGHRSGGRPLTLEGGVLRVADALDMAKGRSRIPFEAGSVSIHSISAAAVERVILEAGEQKPVRISIEINNSAGIFQLDQLFREKLRGSGLEPYLEMRAFMVEETEKRLFRQFTL
jgi:uncharacterized protein